MAKRTTLYLGATRPLTGGGQGQMLLLPASHLATHGVIVGMTGSGKTGLVTVLAEEALRTGIPILMIDVKGDLPNLLLSFPTFDAAPLASWVTAGDEELDPAAAARALAEERAAALQSWQIHGKDLERYHAASKVRVITPGSTAGEPLHVLSGLERPSARWIDDTESARAALAAAVSLVLRLLGRDADPARSREHVLLSVLAERRLRSSDTAELGALLNDLEVPPISEIGALPLNRFSSKNERQNLAAALNGLLASPTFASWREGATLDVENWLTLGNATAPRSPGVIISVAHLDDEERTLVLGVLLEEILTWVRTLPGSRRLRALVLFDEVFGFMPPHPASPATKRPLVALMKQARAFGVGVVVATQNPMDLDYRALSNAGLWCVGRLQTDADRARVIEAMASRDRELERQLSATVKNLDARWFLLRNVHQGAEPMYFQPRQAVSLLRGPMTRSELRAILAQRIVLGEQPRLEPPR